MLTEHEPPANDAAQGKLVIFVLGNQEFGIDITAVREIRGWTAETPLPQAPPYVRGVINLRGVVLPIMDLSARLGLGACTPTPRHVNIVVVCGKRLLGLLVDAVSDVVPLEADGLQKRPDIACGTAARLVTGLVNVADRLVAVLAVEEVFALEEDAA